MLNPRVVGKHNISARSIAEQSDHRRVGAVQNSYDAAFGALPGRAGCHAAQLYFDVVAVHGVADGFARNKNIAIQLRHGTVWNHKAVAVLMQDQAAGEGISARTRGCCAILAASNRLASLVLPL